MAWWARNTCSKRLQKVRLFFFFFFFLRKWCMDGQIIFRDLVSEQLFLSGAPVTYLIFDSNSKKKRKHLVRRVLSVSWSVCCLHVKTFGNTSEVKIGPRDSGHGWCWTAASFTLVCSALTMSFINKLNRLRTNESVLCLWPEKTLFYLVINEMIRLWMWSRRLPVAASHEGVLVRLEV